MFEQVGPATGGATVRQTARTIQERKRIHLPAGKVPCFCLHPDKSSNLRDYR